MEMDRQSEHWQVIRGRERDCTVYFIKLTTSAADVSVLFESNIFCWYFPPKQTHTCCQENCLT